MRLNCGPGKACGWFYFQCGKNNGPVAAIIGQGACIRWLPNMCVRSVAGLSVGCSASLVDSSIAK